jgi:hypothetical protein
MLAFLQYRPIFFKCHFSREKMSFFEKMFFSLSEKKMVILREKSHFSKNVEKSHSSMID